MVEIVLLHIIEIMGTILLFPIAVLILFGTMVMLIYSGKAIISWWKAGFPVSL